MVVLAALAGGVAYAETNFDTVRFIQYLDESTALDEVRKGNIQMYYWRIPSERLADSESRDGIQIFESTGNSYSILTNPAKTDTLNPFSIREVRFALNYMLDRDFVVNELMGGFGAPAVSYYGPYDPEYISVLEDLESYNFHYNPVLARSMIDAAMEGAGAVREGDAWMADGQPVTLNMFIRSDDSTRKSLGEVLALELEGAGFAVNRDYGDLNKAFVTVYGSDPADLQWHLYTEGWGRSGFVKYDSVGLAQMYAPWFSNMPGFNDPSFWNYENERLDNLTQAIYSGDFESARERTELVRQALAAGVDEGVRVFVATRVEQYVASEGVGGIINDFGAGIPSRFTPINARSDSDSLDIGVKQIYQGSWNPVSGLSDLYSRHVWNVVWDPGVFRHPYSGSAMPVRADWEVRTAGPNDSLDVPPDAVLWDTGSQSWVSVGEGVRATSSVTFDYAFGNWHHGVPMGMDDILYTMYFSTEWGTDDGEGDRTTDPDYTPRASQGIETMRGIRAVDSDTLEVYVDYWHFDDGEIADWAVIWPSMPWELYHAMGQAVLDGKTAFSRSAATSKEVSWLSVIVPNDAALLGEYARQLADSGAVPRALADAGTQAALRYGALASWIDRYGHAAISNGPYMVQGYSPESRTITLLEFDDESYPFPADRWSHLETVSVPRITNADVPARVESGKPFQVTVAARDASSVKYFVIDSTGMVAASGDAPVEDGGAVISVDTDNLAPGASTMKIFALSDTVLRPSSHTDAFFVAQASGDAAPESVEPSPPRDAPPDDMDPSSTGPGPGAWLVVIPVAGAILAGAVYALRRRSRGS